MGLDATWFRESQRGFLDELLASEAARRASQTSSGCEDHQHSGSAFSSQNKDENLNKVAETIEQTLIICEEARRLADSCSRSRQMIHERGSDIREAMQAKVEKSKLEEIRKELKTLKNEDAERQKRAKHAQTSADEAVANFGNLVNVEIVMNILASIRNTAEEPAATQENSSLAKTYEAKEFLKSSLGLKTKTLESLEALRGKWLDESVELPQYFIQSESSDRVIFVCRGEDRWSAHAVRTFTWRLLNVLSTFHNNARAEAVAPNALDIADSYAVEIRDSNDVPLAIVRNTTDYLSRGLKIRSGAKKHLQVAKKYVHVVIVQLYCSEVISNSSSLDNLRELDFTPPPMEQRLTKQEKEPQHFLADLESLKVNPSRAIELLEYWLRHNSFVGGKTRTALDDQAHTLVKSYDQEMSGIQYPGICQWLEIIQSSRTSAA